MTRGKKNLLVTFADHRYFTAAKQVLAAAHERGGWQGEYMLITPREHEGLSWFRDRGIVVKVLAPPVSFGDLEDFPLTLYIIFHLFIEEFKKYQHVVYLDVDCLIRYSLDAIVVAGKFAASPDVLYQRLASQFVKKQVLTHPYSPSKYVGIAAEEYDRKYLELQKKYDLKKLMFNAGVFSLDTDLIKSDTFSQLCNLAKNFGAISAFPPQGEINLYFYDNWHELSPLYNVYPEFWHTFYHLKYEDIDGVILHFAASKKPWNNSSYFYDEWKEMADKAEHVDFSAPAIEANKLSSSEIKEKERKLAFHRRYWSWVVYFDKMMGAIGLFIKHHTPWLYRALGRTGASSHDQTKPSSTNNNR